MESSSVLDKIIADAMKRPPAQRLKELERLLESAKLSLSQIKTLHVELDELRKRLAPPRKN